MTFVRFNEYVRYDITQDCEVTQFCASISTGTYHMETPVPNSRKLREIRAAFRDEVENMIGSGKPPGKVDLHA